MNWWNIAVQLFWIWAPFIAFGVGFWFYVLKSKEQLPYFNPSEGATGLIVVNPEGVERVVMPMRTRDGEKSWLFWNHVRLPEEFVGFFFVGTNTDGLELHMSHGDLILHGEMQSAYFAPYGRGLRIDAAIRFAPGARLSITKGGVVEEFEFRAERESVLA